MAATDNARALTMEEVEAFLSIPEYNMHDPPVMLHHTDRAYNNDIRSRTLTAQSAVSTLRGLVRQFGTDLFAEQTVPQLIERILQEPIPYAAPERGVRDDVNAQTSMKRLWVLHQFVTHFPDVFRDCSRNADRPTALRELSTALERVRETHRAALIAGERILSATERTLILRWDSFVRAVRMFCATKLDTTSIETAQNCFMALLFTLRPPRRCDYATLIIDLVIADGEDEASRAPLTLSKNDDRLVGQNYVKRWRDGEIDSYTVVLQHFKTVALRQTPFEIRLTPIEIEAYLHLRRLLLAEQPQHRQHLMQAQPTASRAATDTPTARIQACFRHVCGLPLSADALRKMYFISHRDKMADYDAIHAIAAAMSTSPATAVEYYNLSITEAELDANDARIVVGDDANMIPRRKQMRTAKDLYALQKELLRRTRGVLWDNPNHHVGANAVDAFLRSDQRVIAGDGQTYVISQVFHGCNATKIYNLRKAVKREQEQRG